MSSHEKSSWGASHELLKTSLGLGQGSGLASTPVNPQELLTYLESGPFPFKVLIIELTSKVTLDSPRSYLQVKHLFPTDEHGLKPESAGSSVTSLSFSLSFLPLFLPPLSRQHNGSLAVGELASLPGRLVGHSEDAGRLLHDPHEEVVDVVLQLPDVRVLPPQELFVLHQLLQDLLVGQAAVPGSGIKRVAVLEQERARHFSSQEENPNYFELQLLVFLCPWLEPTWQFTERLVSSEASTGSEASKPLF